MPFLFKFVCVAVSHRHEWEDLSLTNLRKGNKHQPLSVVTLMLLAYLIVGTLYYCLVHHWSVLDAVYFSVYTVPYPSNNTK